MWKKFSKKMARVPGTRAATTGRKRRRPRPFLAQVEALQERLVPATLSNGILYIYGTGAADVVSVTNQSGSIKVTENGRSRLFSVASVSGKQVFFYGGNGNDRFVNSTGLRATAYGQNGADVLI